MIRLFRSSFGPIIRSTFSARKLCTHNPTGFRDDGSDNSDGYDEPLDEFDEFDDTKDEIGVEVEPEIHFVKLIGTTYSDSVVLPSKNHSCKVIQKYKTEDGEEHSISHLVTISKECLKSIGLTGLVKNQRLNINGYIRSIPFTTSLGTTKRAIAILPDELKIYKEDTLPDICIVLLTAYVDTNVKHKTNISEFDLRTHVNIRDKQGTFTGKLLKHAHSIIVHDPKVIKYLRAENITKDDYIHVKGYLSYQKCETILGKSKMCGQIIAVDIELVEKNKNVTEKITPQGQKHG